MTGGAWPLRLAEVETSGRLHVTTNVIEAVQATELSFVCVGTPTGANGAYCTYGRRGEIAGINASHH